MIARATSAANPSADWCMSVSFSVISNPVLHGLTELKRSGRIRPTARVDARKAPGACQVRADANAPINGLRMRRGDDPEGRPDRSWRFHPLAALFPIMADDEIADLSISAHHRQSIHGADNSAAPMPENNSDMANADGPGDRKSVV